MKTPVLDPRDLRRIMEEIAAHARQYTPEWRYEKAEDDPGAAIAQLFGEMFNQTVDRFNSVPEKLYMEFLDLIGVNMPDPVPAQGLLRFRAHETVTEPVPVPGGTQVYVPEEDGDGIVYETERAIQATAAELKHLFYVDSRQGVIQELELDQPRSFFTANEAENLQCHRFSVGQDDVLDLRSPGTIQVQVRAESPFAAEETAGLLSGADMAWSYRRDGRDVPFDAVERQGAHILLTKSLPGPIEPDEGGVRSITCSGAAAEGTVRVDGILLKSASAGWCGVDSMACGDIAILREEGGYCFGRRPAAYGMFYIQSDQCFRKRGALVDLNLDITPIVTEPSDTGPHYSFTERIIDKKGAVEIRPDDVYVDEVIWEYYNGSGWAVLPVSGNRNPFSCKDSGALDTVFTVPDDISPVEVNAREGYFIRARVLHVVNELSLTPRWIVPFVRSAKSKWQYRQGRPAQVYRSVNNGDTAVLEDASQVRSLQFPVIVSMPREPRAMYFCFDRSPHAMPLSVLFELAGRAPMDDKLSFEVWSGSGFDQIHSLDMTRNFLHSGQVLLYIPDPIPASVKFGREGYWVRVIRSSYQENSGGYPKVRRIVLNAVNALQRKKEEPHIFDTDVYEAYKRLSLLEPPVLDCEVWVNEVNGLTAAEAEDLAKARPDAVRLEYEDGRLSGCWVCWRRTGHLSLCGGDERAYELDAHEGVVLFGDGIHGKVPPVGQRNISVSYNSGGGQRGNRPAGTGVQLLGSVPRISSIESLTQMSGGTDRFPIGKLQELGNKRLRHRGRALGVSDFEEMVKENFPQALHVKCFARRDESYRQANGHVTVVVDTWDSGRGACELCDRVYAYLEPRCSCSLTGSGQLHVIPSTVVTINTEVTVEVADLDQAAITQQQISARLDELIGQSWRRRDIGDQVRVDQIWQVVRDTPNVLSIRKIMVEGVYDENGITRSIPLESDRSVPYATVAAGKHRIRLGRF